MLIDALRCTHKPECDLKSGPCERLQLPQLPPKGTSCDKTLRPWSARPGCRAFTATSQLRTVSKLYHETGVGPHDSWTQGRLQELMGIGECGGWCCLRYGPSLLVRYGSQLRRGPRLTTAGKSGLQIRGLPHTVRGIPCRLGTTADFCFDVSGWAAFWSPTISTALKSLIYSICVGIVYLAAI